MEKRFPPWTQCEDTNEVWNWRKNFSRISSPTQYALQVLAELSLRLQSSLPAPAMLQEGSWGPVEASQSLGQNWSKTERSQDNSGDGGPSGEWRVTGALCKLSSLGLHGCPKVILWQKLTGQRKTGKERTHRCRIRGTNPWLNPLFLKFWSSFLASLKPRFLNQDNNTYPTGVDPSVKCM